MQGNLEVNSIFVDEYSQLTARGTLEILKRVKFRIGDHGPFTALFNEATYTPENVAAAIEKQVAVLRSLP